MAQNIIKIQARSKMSWIIIIGIAILILASLVYYFLNKRQPTYSRDYRRSVPLKELTDQDLLGYAASEKEKVSFDDKGYTVSPHFILGRYSGAEIKVDFYNTDVYSSGSPYDKRIISYNVDPNEKKCKKIDGVIVTEAVPMGISGGEVSFCVPKILSENDKYKK